MQARLTFRQTNPFLGIALFAIAIAAALLLGATLGYVLRPAAAVNGSTRLVVLHDESGLYATTDATSTNSYDCVWNRNTHIKAC